MKEISILLTVAVTAGCLAGGMVWGVEPTKGELSEAALWASAKFGGVQQKRTDVPSLVVLANNDPVQKNGRGGKPMNIAKKPYTRGLYCHAFSQVRVILPEPGETFTSVVGVDSNEQTGSGRGSVRFSVLVGGTEKAKTEVLREGMPGVPVKVNLDGATEFLLQADDGGDGIACDQSDWADAQVVLKSGKTLWLADLPLENGGKKAPYSVEPFFSFKYNAKSSSELLSGWDVKRSSKKLDENRTEWTLLYIDTKTGLQVRCVAIEYHDYPTVEWTVYFKNSGTENTPILSDILAIDTRFERGGAGNFVLHHNKGTFVRADDFEPLTTVFDQGKKMHFSPPGGRSCGAVWPYYNLESTDEGTIIVVGWPGQWKADFVREGNAVHVTAGQEETHFYLKPGEEIRTPLIAMQFWQGDWMRSQNIWRRWMVAHNVPRLKDGKLPGSDLSPCSSHQFGEMIRANEACQIEFIDRYVEEGFAPDHWWMDAGWYVNNGDWPNTGTWEVDTNRFPRGLRAITDHGHRKGVKSIVWFEPERVNPGTWLYDKHPEWLLNGDQPQDQPHDKLLNLGNPAALDWVINHIDKIITEQGIDLYRQDYNIAPLSYWKSGDAADRQGITENHYVSGYLEYWDELRHRHPGMLIDSCASGGHRNDLETMRRSLPFLRSDYIFDVTSNQGQTYGLSFWLPYQGTGTAPGQMSLYELRSNMSCLHDTPCWDVRNRSLNYEFLRKVIHQWRDYAENYYGDYYPLTPYSSTLDSWIVWQFDRPEKDTGMVQAFRRDGSVYEAARFRLHGLDEKARYTVTDIDNPGAKQEYDGRELMEKGLRLDTTNQPAALVFVYKKN